MTRMDQNAPRENPETKPLKPARVALNVLALCFALSVLGRGVGRRWPTAIAFVYAAAGAGVLLRRPASQVLVAHVGWRAAFQILGGAAVFRLLPLLALPWGLFPTGSPHLAKSPPADLADEGWI